MNDSSMNDSYLKEIVSKNRKKNSESDDDSEGYSDQENVEKKPIINLLDES
jgi:hypothetical protein